MKTHAAVALRPGLAASCIAIAMLVACDAPAEQPADARIANEAPQVSSTEQLLLASAKVALPPQGVRVEDLPEPTSPGARALQTYCTTCHELPTPAMHSATDWPGVIRRMWLRMDLLQPPFEVRTPELGERIVMLDYLTANALTVSHALLPDAPGRPTFESQCAQCHALPDPAQHSAQDWFVVIRRMNQHMQEILGKELSTSQIDSISRYLGGITSS